MGDTQAKQLPELTDEDIRVLDLICKRAARLRSPPYQALYSCYDAVLEEQGIEERHDNVLFRWLHSIIDVVDKERRHGAQLTIIDGFRALLTEYGITVVDDDHEQEDHTHHSLDDRSSLARAGHNLGRRVSFDDARYEESWLSAHSQTLHDNRVGLEPPLPLSTRSRTEHSARRHARARSVPNEYARDGPADKHVSLPNATVDHDQHSSTDARMRGADYAAMADLESQADAVFDMKTLKTARQRLRDWRHLLHTLRQHQERDRTIARKHDFRVLAKQVWDLWLAKAKLRLIRREDEARLIAAEARLENSHLDLRRRVVRQWLSRLDDVETVVSETREHMLRFRYFSRWKSIAVENATKLRLILTRKFFLRWHDLSLERRMEPEVVERLGKRIALRRHVRKWHQQLQETQAERYHEHQLRRRAFLRWSDASSAVVQTQRRADDYGLRHALLHLGKRLHHHQRALLLTAAKQQQQRDRGTKLAVFNVLRKRILLNAKQSSYQDDVDDYLRRKAWDSLKGQLERASKAREWQRTHTKQMAWTQLFDAFRVAEVTNWIDLRLKRAYISRLQLEELLRVARRHGDLHLCRRLLNTLRAKLTSQTSTLQQQSAICAEASQRRTLSCSVQRLHIVLRSREDAARLAVEEANAKMLPKVILSWQQQSQQVQTLQKWATDAQFFVFTKKYLKLWQSKTETSMKSKRRLAYERIRDRVKTRALRSCLTIWRSRTAQRRACEEEANIFDQGRLRAAVHLAFQTLRTRSSLLFAQRQQATEFDLLKLQHTCLINLESRHGHLKQDEELAVSFREEVDQAIIAIILKRLRFAAFSAARLDDNSRMLRERLTQHRHRQMLRHLAVTASARQTARAEETDIFGRDPESPSARPASRAASRSASRPASVKRADAERSHDIPAYLRTPARGRRGRFRTLPTPAPYTPFTFTPGTLMSTPLRPLDAAEDSELADTRVEQAQITPFERKLRAGGVSTSGSLATSLRRSVLSRNIGTGVMSTGKSVRFMGSNSKRAN